MPLRLRLQNFPRSGVTGLLAAALLGALAALPFFSIGQDSPDACPAEAEGALQCEDRLKSESGVSLWWTVREGGLYRLEVDSTDGGPPLDPVLSVRDEADRPVAQTDSDGAEGRAQIQRGFEAGVYQVNVHDYLHQVIRGGAPFRLRIGELPVPLPPSLSVPGTGVANSSHP